MQNYLNLARCEECNYSVIAQGRYVQKPVIVIWLVAFAVQKVVIGIWLVTFVVQKFLIVRDWLISADDVPMLLIFESRVLLSILLSRASTAWCNNFLALSSMCLAGSRDVLYLLTELIMFTDWCWNERYVIILSINLMNYALNVIYLKAFWRGMPDSRMLSFWFLHWIFRVVEFQTSVGPPRLHILVLEHTKYNHTLRISYTIVIPRRNVPAVRIGLRYSSIITVKLQKQIGNNTAFLSVQEL